MKKRSLYCITIHDRLCTRMHLVIKVRGNVDYYHVHQRQSVQENK